MKRRLVPISIEVGMLVRVFCLRIHAHGSSFKQQRHNVAGAYGSLWIHYFCMVKRQRSKCEEYAV